MADEIKTWLINPRGRPVYVDENQVAELIIKGFQRFTQGTPKETYYPNLDQNFNKELPKETVKTAERLPVIVID